MRAIRKGEGRHLDIEIDQSVNLTQTKQTAKQKSNANNNNTTKSREEMRRKYNTTVSHENTLGRRRRVAKGSDKR